MPVLELSSKDGKYKFTFNEHTGESSIYRHGELWDANVKYSKFFIDLLYQFQDLKEEQNQEDVVPFVKKVDVPGANVINERSLKITRPEHLHNKTGKLFIADDGFVDGKIRTKILAFVPEGSDKAHIIGEERFSESGAEIV